MKLDKVAWFTTSDGKVIGVVLGRDEMTDVPKAYIGVCGGKDERSDLAMIVLKGAQFPVAAAQALGV